METKLVIKLITANYRRLLKKEGFVIAEAYLLGALLQGGFKRPLASRIFTLYTTTV